jgi:hypothetical protein
MHEYADMQVFKDFHDFFFKYHKNVYICDKQKRYIIMTDPEQKKNSEDAEENSSTSNENTNPPPKDKDELYIELDDSAEENTNAESADNSQTAAQKNETPESPKNSEEPIQAENTDVKTSTKKKPSKKVKPKKSTHKAKPPKEKKIPGDKSGKGKKRLIIFGSAIGVILIAGIIMFTQYPKVLANWMPFLEMKGYVDSEVLTETPDGSVAEDTESSEIATIDSLQSEIETAIEENIDKETATEKNVSEEEVVDAITKDLQKKQQQYSGASQMPTTKIETPSWIIGYASVSINNNAIRSVKSLRDKGYSAGYFWIPDYTQGGPDLFKIYIGPFDSKAEAQNLLPTIKELVPKAYVMYLE